MALLMLLCLTGCGDNGRDKGENVESAYSDPQKMTTALLDAIFNGNGEDLWEAGNFDAFLDFALKYDTVESIDKDEMLDSFNEICEEFQKLVAAEPDAEWSYEFSGVGYSLSKSEIEAVRDEIDPDGTGLEIEDIAIQDIIITKRNEGYDYAEDYDYATIAFLKVDGEYMVYTVQRG